MGGRVNSTQVLKVQKPRLRMIKSFVLRKDEYALALWKLYLLRVRITVHITHGLSILL